MARISYKTTEASKILVIMRKPNPISCFIIHIPEHLLRQERAQKSDQCIANQLVRKPTLVLSLR